MSNDAFDRVLWDEATAAAAMKHGFACLFDGEGACVQCNCDGIIKGRPYTNRCTDPLNCTIGALCEPCRADWASAFPNTFVRDDVSQCSIDGCESSSKPEIFETQTDAKPVCCGAACLGCNRCPPFHVKRADEQQIQRWQLELVHPPVNPPMEEDEPE